MLPNRSRTASLAAIMSLALSVAGLSAPVAAADSPEAAVNEFFDLVQSGDFTDLESVVCASDVPTVREAFDIGASLGLEGDAAAGVFSREVRDRSVDLLDEQGDQARLRVAATVSMQVPDDQVEGLVRAMLSADQGPDDPPPSDDDVQMMVGVMGSALNQTLPLDAEVTAVRESGEWLVCGGLIEPPDEPDPGFEPSVSTDGACALASPDELTALGPLAYDSSMGFESFCSFSSSDFSNYHQLSIEIGLDRSAENLAGAYGADQVVSVDGYQALASGPDSFARILIVQVGPDTVTISVSEPETPPDGFEWLDHATAVAELVIPRLAGLREELAGPTPAPTPEPTPEIPLCGDDLSLEEVNALTGLGFDDRSTDAASCSYTSFDGEPGFHSLVAYVNPGSLDDYRLWLPDVEEGAVSGMPALITENQVIVELPGDAGILDVAVLLDPGDASVSASAREIAEVMAERIAADATD